ncbi:MAG TPA: hypothetical protein VMU94_00070, partial [Streptosporangiaceae bacterium]|nr:hypothetical protein [Streptosporangiaceae bacterium]
AQRGKAKQKRTDLRLAGLGLVVTRDGGIPLTWHAYPGDRPDVTQFARLQGLDGSTSIKPPTTVSVSPSRAITVPAGFTISRGFKRAR